MNENHNSMPNNAKAVIAILDDYENFVEKLDAFSLLKAAMPNADIRIFFDPLSLDVRQKIADIEYLVLIRERTRVDDHFLSKFPSLKAICQTGTIGLGMTAHVDVAACEARGIRILQGKTDGYSAAELTWTVIMSTMRQVFGYTASLRAGDWQRRNPPGAIGETLRGKTLGVLGYGRIGQMLAGYGKAFGMSVQAWGRESTLEKARSDGVSVPRSREEFFSTSDVLTLHLRLNEDTRYSVLLDDLQKMKLSAVLVNTSRAELIEPGALLAALDGGRPGRAAIDVYEREPVLKNDPLLMHDNIYATPHIGYVEKQSYEILFGSAFGELVSLFN